MLTWHHANIVSIAHSYQDCGGVQCADIMLTHVVASNGIPTVYAAVLGGIVFWTQFQIGKTGSVEGLFGDSPNCVD